MAQLDEINEAREKLVLAFLPAESLAEADLVKSQFEMLKWFAELGVELTGKEMATLMNEAGFEMRYSGSMYLWMLRNR